MPGQAGRKAGTGCALAMAAALVLAGCANTPSDTGPSPSDTPSSQAPSSQPPGSPTPVSPSASAGDAAVPDNATDYADAFIRAWGAGDMASMQRLATTTAISQVRQLAEAGGPNWARITQDAAAGSVFLTYQDSGNGARLQLRVSNDEASNSREHAVAEARILAYPIPDNATDYADAFVQAWGEGNGTRMEQLATESVIDALGEYGPRGGPNWERTGQDAGAGSAFVSYRNSKDDWTLELRLSNEAASNARGQAVVEAKLER